MGESKSYVEIAIFLAGWILMLGGMRQGQKDQRQNVEDMQKAFDKFADATDARFAELARANSMKFDELTKIASVLSSGSLLHGEQIATLRSSSAAFETNSRIAVDEVRGDLSRHGKQLSKVEKWCAVANSCLKRLDGSWQPPVNGD